MMYKHSTVDLLRKLKYITEVHRSKTWRLAELEMLNSLYCRGVSVNVCMCVCEPYDGQAICPQLHFPITTDLGC